MCAALRSQSDSQNVDVYKLIYECCGQRAGLLATDVNNHESSFKTIEALSCTLQVSEHITMRTTLCHHFEVMNWGQAPRITVDEQTADLCNT